MGISFAQSLEQMKNEQSTDSVGTYTELLPAKKQKTFAEIDKPITATDDWTLSDEYKYYPDYFDDVVSSIDSRKNIILDSNQINITQETNSQFIPFKMSRYYDGFDLVNTRLSIYFINKNNRGYESTPINVYYNSSTIKFAWLTDRRVTAVSGKIRFEIRATGVNSNGDEYVWKTKPCDGLNVIESLTGDITLPDDGENPEDASSIYANVAEVSDETAVSDIVTALKAFNLQTSDAVRVVDSLNELGNRYAVSAADLGDGLSKSASAMNAAGTDMYKTLAMLTGGAEITQNAGEFGSFLKVASMRLRGMKGQLEALGEEVDPAVDSISKVQTQILNLTGGKVNIFDGAGEFRDYYDIMADIAEVYDDLSSTDQANLTEILFGKMRGNQGQALIQAFQSGQIQAAYTDAVNSMGSAAAEQEAWMQSLEAKTQQFQAAWQGLSQTVLSSDFLKGAVDAGTGLLNVLEGIIDTITLPGTLAAGGGMFAFFKNLD